MKEGENILVQELTQRHGEEKRIRCGWQAGFTGENAGQCERKEVGARVRDCYLVGKGAPWEKEIGGIAEEETLEPGRPAGGPTGSPGRSQRGLDWDRGTGRKWKPS